MLRKPSIAVIAATLYMAIYMVFFYRSNINVVMAMFLAAPAMLIWLAYTIVRYGKFDGKELQDDEEWGYSDRDKDSLGVF
ncbi:MAG TPA: hypothetical protein VFZ47_05455 [Chitinophagaceae bacterium]